MSQYATEAEFYQLGLPADAVEELTSADINTFLQDASGLIDMYLASRYTLPLTSPYPDALRRFAVCIATYHIMLRRGFNPETEDDKYRVEHDGCLEMLQKIADGKLTVPGIIDATHDVSESAPSVYTKPLRGW